MEKIYILIILILISVIIILRSLKYKSLVDAEKKKLKNLYKNQVIYLYDAADYLGKNLIQLYGESFGGTIRPNMRLVGPNGIEYIIKEVYANDKTPDKPDSEIPNGMNNTAIVIKGSERESKAFRQSVKKKKVLALKVY